MLKVLRKKGVAKRIIWVVVIVIIISFGFMGTAYLIIDKQSNNYAGKIFGQRISFNQFEKIYGFVRIQAIIQYGEKYSDVAPHLNMDAETWDRLIALHEAKKRKIQVTDSEVVTTIEQYPFFQRNGQFDTLIYNDILRYSFRINPRDFEEGIRNTIKLAKLYNMETAFVSVDENEVHQTFNSLNEKIQVSYCSFSPEDYIDQAAFDESAAKKYYEENKGQFAIPTSINVAYIQLPFPENKVADDPSSSTENSEQADQTTPDETAQETLIEEQKEALRKQALDLFEEVNAQEDLVTAAKSHNLDVKETGYFSKENPPLALGWSFELFNALFDLDVNHLSGPYESSNGIQIIKVTDRKESTIPEYDQVKDEVKRQVMLANAMTIAKQKSGEFLPLIQQAYAKSTLHDFAQIIKDLNLKAQQTPLFSRGQYIPLIGISNEFQDAAFLLNDDKKISDVVELPSGYYILHLDSYEKANESDYEKQREDIMKSMLTDKKNATFGDFFSRLRQEARLQDNIAKLKEQNG